MTSTRTEVARSARAGRRRALHLARINTAPTGRRRQWLVMAWLHAEIAAGGDLQRVLELADELNADSR
jgi:hypothetical protein